MMRLLISAAFVTLILLRAADASDDTGPAAVKGAIAIVVVKGVLPAQGNAPVALQGTGFFISKYGYLVTAYHLRGNLGAVDDGTVSYEVHFTTLTSDPIPASFLFASPAADIMVLYAPVGDEDVPILRLSDVPIAKIVPGKTIVYTGGYPSGYGFSVDQGVIKSLVVRSPPIPAWATSLTFKDGQSGSPILLDDNRVIGIARGNDTDATSIGLVVPTKLVPREYWDGGPVTAAAAEAINTGNAPSVTIQAEANAGTPRQMTQEFMFTNRNCAPPSQQTRTISADAGTKIDPKSINLVVLSLQGNVAYSVSTANSSGFAVSAQLNNAGKCDQQPGNSSSSDINAKIVLRANYAEIPDHPQTVTVSEVNAVVGNVSAPLPDVPTNKLTFTATTPSGQKFVFQPLANEVIKLPGGTALNTEAVIRRVIPSLHF
jgi:hypothetical protein